VLTRMMKKITAIAGEIGAKLRDRSGASSQAARPRHYSGGARRDRRARNR
jgi:hypothetical protein